MKEILTPIIDSAKHIAPATSVAGVISGDTTMQWMAVITTVITCVPKAFQFVKSVLALLKKK